MTRALSPYNDLIGLARGDDFKIIDRKQGVILTTSKIHNQFIE